MRHLFAFLFLCTFHVAHADVLFLDLNNSPAEIQAAERAAKKRGEKLIVIGAPPKENAKKIQELTRTMMDYQKKIIDSANSGQDVAVLMDEYNKTAQEMYKLNARVTPESLAKDLKDLQAKGVKLSSMVISGHDGNGSFSGTQGSLDAQTIRHAFDQSKPLGDDIRSLVLAGCYTGTIGTVETNWKNITPNINVIAGYDLKAPLGDKKAGHDYIEEVLVKEKSLTEARDKKALEKAFRGIKNVSMLDASICVDDNFVNKSGVKNITEAKKECEQYVDGKKITQWTERIQCYLRAEVPECANPPADTSRGELRVIYNELQAAKHCEEMLQARQITLPNPDIVIRLIFNGEVMKNFARLHRDDLSELDASIAAAGFPKELQLGDITKLSRGELMKKVSELSAKFGEEKDPKDVLGARGEAYAKLAAQFSSLGSLISGVPQCLPFSWVESNSHDRSRCVNKAAPELVKRYQMSYFQAALVEKARRSAVSASGDMNVQLKTYKAALMNEREKLKDHPDYDAAARDALNQLIKHAPEAATKSWKIDER